MAGRDPAPSVAWLAAVATVAFAVRLVPVLTSGGLRGAPNYDPAVYATAAVGFFEGRLPYRDFLLLHPPGIVLLLQPFAALGQWTGDPAAFAVARVAFMVGGAVSAALVFWLLRPLGLFAALAGAGLYAVHPAAAHVERATWLEAPASLMLLLALVALRPGKEQVRPWRLAAAGGLLALAALTKLWGVAPLAVVLVWFLVTRGVRTAALALLGAALTALAVLAPFWSVIPALWNDVVIAQLGRPGARTDPLIRGGTLLGLGQSAAAAVPPALLAIAALLVVALVALASRRTAGRLYLALLAATAVVVLATPSWYPNYPAFTAAPLALAFGAAVAVVSEHVPRVHGRVVAGMLATLLCAGVLAQLISKDGFSFPGDRLAGVLASREGCVTTDQPVALLLTDRLRTDLRRGCPLMADLSGYIHVVSGSDQRRDNAEFQQLMMDYLAGGRTTIVWSGMWPDDFRRENRARVRSWPVIGQVGRLEVREPAG